MYAKKTAIDGCSRLSRSKRTDAWTKVEAANWLGRKTALNAIASAFERGKLPGLERFANGRQYASKKNAFGPN